MQTTIIWTALPAGIRQQVDGRWMARVSVFVSPRLEPAEAEGTLAESDWFRDWPSSLDRDGGRLFDLRIADGPSMQVERAVRSVSIMDSQAWRAVLPSRTPVRSPMPPDTAGQDTTRLLSYPATELMREVRRVYARTLAFELGATQDSPSLTAFQPNRTLRSSDSNNADPLGRFLSFHQRAASPRINLESAAEVKPDFHQQIAGLGTHAPLMRRLGLVLDFEIPEDDLALSGLAQPRMQILPRSFEDDRLEHVGLWTAVDYGRFQNNDYRVFTAQARDTDMLAGFQLLGRSTGVAIAQENIEQTALSLIQHAAFETQDPLPAMLQEGMRVLDPRVVGQLESSIHTQSRLEAVLGSERNRQAASEAVEVLYSEDVTRGLRVDVREAAGGSWFSLCQRANRYWADRWQWPPDGESVLDEGVIEPMVFTDQQTVDPSETRVVEDLFNWDGWSLVVARPGQDDSDGDATEHGVAVDVSSEVPAGTLLPQRFGRHYQFRARTVDLAGNSLSLEEADGMESAMGREVATEPVCCARVESAKPPVLIRAQRRGTGEAGDTAVLRDAESREYQTLVYRLHLLPPPVSLRIAEKHGVLDGMSPERAWQLIEDHQGGNEFDSDDDVPEAIGSEELFAPYLPDPWVTRAVLELPNGDTVELPAFDDLPVKSQARHLARSVLLEFYPGGEKTVAKVRKRRVSVSLPMGRVHQLRIGALPRPESLACAAPLQSDWQGDSHGLSTTELASRTSERGAPSLMPPRTIKLVCASQRPLAAPSFVDPYITERGPGATGVVLLDENHSLDRPSTGRIDVYANWEELVDNPEVSGWQIVSGALYAGGTLIKELPDEPEFGQPDQETRSPALAHDFGDTRHRLVSYTAVAQSRFIDFYPEVLTREPENMTRRSQPVMLRVPATAPPEPPSVARILPTLRREVPISEQRQQSIVSTGSGLRVYLHRGWFSSGRDERLAVLLPNPETPDALAEELSAWGVNPLRDGAPLPAPLAHGHIINALEQLPDWHMSAGPVALSIHEVGFSEEHGLPFADIEFEAQHAHLPLVRLALARYQANAISDCNLSASVLADFVPLASGRSLTVTTLDHDRWQLDMHGHSYKEPIKGNSDAGTSVVQAQVQFMSAKQPEDAAAWQAHGEPVTLKANTDTGWAFHWRGECRIQASDVLSRRWRRRIVVQEYEPFAHAGADDSPLADRARLISAQVIAI